MNKWPHQIAVDFTELKNSCCVVIIHNRTLDQKKKFTACHAICCTKKIQKYQADIKNGIEWT